MSIITSESVDEIPSIVPRRKISGTSAILLPLESPGAIDWQGFRDHVARTADAGLIPAVNMDTGYANLITDQEREQVLVETKSVLGGEPFVAGAFVCDQPGDPFDFDTYRIRLDQITGHGGTPIIFQSFGLTSQDTEGIVDSYTKIGEHAGDFLAFELSDVFAPFGKVYDLDVYEGLLGIEQCRGAKHSSLSRVLEWQRIKLRDRIRPDFKVMTGNDLAIDMVIYGSDYLLGLSTFAPDAFARRDAMWENGDAGFYELNDLLQYLGFFTFRDPVPAYKHNAAQFLHARGWIKSSLTYAGSPTRPDSDVDVLRKILNRLS